jgi:TatD DNase family protein
MIIDTHCHIHDSEFFLENREEAYRESREAGVVMVCVGTNVQSSKEAINFCRTHEACYPVVGIHPHDTKDNDTSEIRALVEANREQIVGIGEIGLDYFYGHSDRETQMRVLREQLQIAQDFDLPVSFHVREAFDDFWTIFDEFPGIRGVLHSFTDSQANLDEARKRGLLIGVNGISTFTKEAQQQRLFTEVSLEDILLETDAPFLTPKPFRGKMNLPAYVTLVAAHQAELKSVSPDDVIRATTANAQRIFGIQ